MDAHLAALAIEDGATLNTNDRDFARFPGLRVEYPIQQLERFFRYSVLQFFSSVALTGLPFPNR